VTFIESYHLGLGYVRPWRFDMGSCEATFIDGYPLDFYRIFFFSRQFSELKKWSDFGFVNF
jgi:hypothetical protein